MIWSPFDRSIKHHIYDHYAEQMRVSSLFLAPSKVVFSLDYQSAKHILNEEDTFLSNPPIRAGKYHFPGFDRMMKHCLLTNDGENHQKNKSVMNGIYGLSGMEKKVEAHADELLSQLQKRPHFDITQDLLKPIATSCLVEILGIGNDSKEKMYEWSSILLRSVDAFVGSRSYLEMEKASIEFEAFVGRSIQEVRHDSFIKQVLLKLSESEPQEEALAKTVSLVANLLFTGISTSIGLLGNVIYELLARPVLWKHLQEMVIAEGEINSMALEELIRFCPSVHFTFRFASQESEFNGLRIAKNQVVAVCLASANRDASVFADPSTINFERTPNPHLAFGTGKHYCFGAKLAKVQLKTILSCVLRMLPDLKLQDEVPLYMKYNFIRGPESIIVRTS